MKDERFEILAKQLTHYSVDLKKGEKVLIEVSGPELPLTKALIKETYALGAIPYVTLKDAEITASLLKDSLPEQIQDMAQWESQRMKEMDAYIGIRAGRNTAEMSVVSDDKMQLYTQELVYPVHMKIRVPKTKWVILRYPNYSMAQAASMSLDDFEDFYFKVCNLNYEKMSQAMTALINYMNATDSVHITGPGTDLTFSIKNIPAIKCDGHMNIPDGEVYTAPVKESIEGHITYNTPSLYQGFKFENIRFDFSQGKIVKATANDKNKLLKILDTDLGARYVGEFAIGVNPYIETPLLDTLFDEKIKGSFHFTPGACYDDADNGNDSAIHWDLVNIQTPAYGGGEIYFDGHLVRKDGLFVVPELTCLNPENLI